MVFLDRATAAEEWREENDDSDDYHKQGHGEHPHAQKIAVTFVIYQNNRSDSHENDSGNLQQ